MRPDDEKRSSYEGSNFIARAKHIDDEKLSSQLMIFLPTEAHRSLSDLTNGQPLEQTQATQNGRVLSGFDVKRIGSFLAFLFLFGIARNNYVAARVCLQNGMVQTGCLLAHQCVENFAKGIMALEPENYYFAKKDDPAQQGKIRVWGHNLIELIQKAVAHTPNMNDILNKDQIKGFLEKLTRAYNPMRYGELSFNVKMDVVIQWLDELASSLDKTYLEKIRAKEETPLFVPDSFREDFLRNNRAFTAEKTTNNPLSVQAMPGVKPPPFPS